MKRIAGLISLIAGTGLIALGVAGTASATPSPTDTATTLAVATITGVPSCPDPGNGWQVVWTLQGDPDTAGTVITTTPTSSAIGAVIAAGGSLTTDPTPVAQDTVSLFMAATIMFGDDEVSAQSTVVTRPAECVKPEPTATPTTVTPTPPPATTEPPAPTTTSAPPPPPRTTTKAPTKAPTSAKKVAPSGCSPAYVGFCVDLSLGDWSCTRGKAPNVVRFRVTLPDPNNDPENLDQNHNGIGCESNPPPPRNGSSTPPPAPSPTIVPVGEIGGTGTGGSLAFTGPAPLVVLLTVGGSLVLLGAGLMVTGRRRKTT